MIDVRVLSNVNGLEDAVIIATDAVYTHTVRSRKNVMIALGERLLENFNHQNFNRFLSRQSFVVSVSHGIREFVLLLASYDK